MDTYNPARNTDLVINKIELLPKTLLWTVAVLLVLGGKIPTISRGINKLSFYLVSIYGINILPTEISY